MLAVVMVGCSWFLTILLNKKQARKCREGLPCVLRVPWDKSDFLTSHVNTTTAQWQHSPAHCCYRNARHVRDVIRDLDLKDGDPFSGLNSRFAVSRNWLSQQTQ
jgi:hypothetical protein